MVLPAKLGRVSVIHSFLLLPLTRVRGGSAPESGASPAVEGGVGRGRIVIASRADRSRGSVEIHDCLPFGSWWDRLATPPSTYSLKQTSLVVDVQRWVASS